MRMVDRSTDSGTNVLSTAGIQSSLCGPSQERNPKSGHLKIIDLDVCKPRRCEQAWLVSFLA